MITGFNPSVAAKNIRDFADQVEAAYDQLQLAIGDLSDGLSLNWGSPKAVEFKTKIKPLFDDLFQTMNDKSVEIQHGAYSAYNIAASSNGEATIADETRGFFDATTFMELFDNIGGKVGMNINVVRNTLLPNFELAMKSGADMLDAVTNSIALYDAGDNQQRAYSTGISNMKEAVLAILESATRLLREALETEADVIFQSAQNAASVLG